MKAVVFTRAPRDVQRLPMFKGRAAREIEIRPMADLRKSLASLAEAPLVCLDVRGLAEKERTRLLSMISTHQQLRFCVLDPAGAIKDVAAVFHAGAIDYLGKGVTGKALTAKRRAAAQAFAERLGLGPVTGKATDNAADAPQPAADAWAGIEQGREYTFAFLLIEVDDAEELKKRHEPANLAAAMETFREFVERIVCQHGGRLWMWSRFGGLVLFPLREQGSLAPLCALRILLSSVFYDIEESLLPGRLSFRMALSIGSTIYREADTGRIVSDAVNSIFHLGRRFARPGQFMITSEAHEMVPQPMRGLFVPVGTFEGRRILRMLRPSSALGMREGVDAWST